VQRLRTQRPAAGRDPEAAAGTAGGAEQAAGERTVPRQEKMEELEKVGKSYEKPYQFID
jgi:hypothetical protein